MNNAMETIHMVIPAPEPSDACGKALNGASSCPPPENGPVLRKRKKKHHQPEEEPV
ncbi:MAG: hypothetical protein R2778_08685 [Saprospiraceae bacterium]